MTSQIQPNYVPPLSVSEQARAFLAAPAATSEPLETMDSDSWQQLVAALDESFLARFPESPLPEDRRDIQGVQVFVSLPTGRSTGDAVCLDLHPGALMFMGGEVCRRLGAFTALSYGMETWSVDYRMPPIHPYPAALDDALTVYRELVEARGAENILVSGTSAGGNLAAALLLRAKDEGLPMPRALVLGTPEVDLTESGDSFQVNKYADTTLQSTQSINLLYANGNDLSEPYLSPLFGNLAGFPSTLIHTGTRDLFLSNSVRMHRRLLAAGAAAELHVFEARPHGGFGGATPEDDELREQVISFIQHHFPVPTPETEAGEPALLPQ
ncbi:alpha/beta hydrolase [Pseudarthrobacter sp. R1]|uniref:alpha/beta hydrolase fold domain-containing protein n=1 Tax=Pseudarthrobacter sp. R1 TaxID=2944934 RepID=UPI002109872B|nr:alpha/beta hydrolase fold domain-containing protein [Pseudarthrobacter sp. R1]MCQ6272313.1 alpha/beta hydrolase [Pseudarthrobacter sp. R1]